ncbi:MAG: MATE family efflux transporter [Faecalibacterium sp.]|nr:MATE family efflux transporter [Faecalibacterium sp.]
MSSISKPAAPTENIMGTMKINKLILQLSVPMMISMLVQALYNVVDSIFVARLSENALTAVSLAFSMQTVMVAVGAGTAVGVNALLSKSLGEKDQDMVNKTAVNGIFLALCSAAAFMLAALLLVRPYFAAQTSDPEIARLGEEYTFIVCFFSQGFFMTLMMEKLLASTGKTKYTMLTQLAGAVTNIILDPIFIFGYMGEMFSGVRGAAIATVIGQFVGAGLGVYLNFKVNHEIHLDFSHFRPHLPTIRRIYQVGAPSIAMQCVGSVMTFGLNKILMGFTATAVAVFGVYFKLQSFIFMPLFGMNSGIVPIIGYNYGARRADRVVSTIKWGVLYAEIIMGTGFLLFQFAPNTLLSLFAANETMLAIGVPALRTISWSFLLAGMCIIFGSSFQALGQGMNSLYTSLSRQIVVLLPVAFLLSRFGDVTLVWLAFPIAELASTAMSVLFMRRTYKNIILPLGNAEAPAHRPD